MNEYKNEWMEAKTCPVCGKGFAVLYPNLWGYKIYQGSNHYKYFCSWKCLRADETRKENEHMKKLTDEQRKHAIEIALAGNSPIVFLELNCGIKNGSQCWTNIKKHLKEEDPEMWDKIQLAMQKARENRYQAKKLKKTPEASATVKLSGPIKIVSDDPEQVDVVPDDDEPKTAGEAMAGCMEAANKFMNFIDDITGREPPVDPKAIIRELNERTERMHMGERQDLAAVEVMGNPVRAIEKEPFGLFFYDTKHNRLDWTSPDGDEISMKPKDWWDFAYAIPEVFAILGVDPNEADPS